MFLNALAELLENEEIDLLLVAGDVCDTTNPSGESQRLFYRTLAGFKQRRPDLTLAISGGNHDSALRLQAPRDLIVAFDIHTIGTVRRKGGAVDADAHLAPVPGPVGEPAAFVLASRFCALRS